MFQTELTERLHDAADTITPDRWIQGEGRLDDQHCAHGAVMRACNTQTADAHIVRAVMRHWGLSEEWNDAGGRTAGEVRDAMLAHKISDDDLAETFGPQWEQVVALVRRAATLTTAEADGLVAARNAAGAAARDTARAAARDTARNAAWDAAGAAARDTARVAAWDAAGAAARDTARNAARALVVRDLIGQGAFTQAYYDTLTRPWREVVGPVHPDDGPLS
ncbi:MAG: DUF6197 family protein [Nocardioidaceae bacterium]